MLLQLKCFLGSIIPPKKIPPKGEIPPKEDFACLRSDPLLGLLQGGGEDGTGIVPPVLPVGLGGALPRRPMQPRSPAPLGHVSGCPFDGLLVRDGDDLDGTVRPRAGHGRENAHEAAIARASRVRGRDRPPSAYRIRRHPVP